jgi:hypothetical protein
LSAHIESGKFCLRKLPSQLSPVRQGRIGRAKLPEGGPERSLNLGIVRATSGDSFQARNVLFVDKTMPNIQMSAIPKFGVEGDRI